MKRYFAYGSNMDKEQMKNRCPQSREIEKAGLVDYEFFINKRGFANIRQKVGKKVLGIIYEISDSDEKELDKYEGVQYGTYKQEYSKLINAFYYLAKETEEGKPKDGYLEKIITASEDGRFPKEYIDELRTWQK